MRVHQRESERPTSSDLLSKFLRRGSHSVAATAASSDPEDDGGGVGSASRKSSSYSNSSNNQQRRPSVNNSRFSTFFFDPLYHAMALGKHKDDASAPSSSSSSTASTYCSEAANGVDEHDKEEAARRQAVLSLQFGDLHAAFDPFGGRDPDDAMDNNELETLLEQKDENRHTLELKAPAAHQEAQAHEEGHSSDEDRSSPESCESQRQLSEDDDDDDDELHFDPPNIAVSVRKLMHRINSMSSTQHSAVNASPRSNQNDDDDSDDEDKDAIAAADDEEDDIATVVSFDNLEPLMLETTVAPTYVPSCFPEAEMPQNLSASFRRLVIDLKDDSERRYETPGHHSFAARRRGQSCPVPIRAAAKSSSAASTSTTAADESLEVVRSQKKSSFGRLAPRLLGTLKFRRKKKTFHYTDEELESIEGARWKIVELAFRFGGKHRFYLVQAVNMFFPLIKYGRRGGPHATRLHCNQSGTLQWQHKRGSLSGAVDLAQVLQILDGRQTAVFLKYASCAALEACSFSLVFNDRTLDLETQSASHRDWLVSALRTLISYAARQREAETRALAERSILPLDDFLSVDILAGLTSPPLTPHRLS